MGGAYRESDRREPFLDHAERLSYSRGALVERVAAAINYGLAKYEEGLGVGIEEEFCKMAANFAAGESDAIIMYIDTAKVTRLLNALPPFPCLSTPGYEVR